MNKRLYYILCWGLILASPHIQSQNIFPFEDKQGQWGYRDMNGKVQIAPRFQRAGYFRQGLALVQNQDNYGVINRQGQAVIAIKHASIKIMSTEPLVCLVFSKTSVGYKHGVIGDNNKTYLPIQYDYILPLYHKAKKGPLRVTKNGKQALYTLQGKALTGFAYDLIEIQHKRDLPIPAKKGALYGYINQEGKQLIPFRYSEASSFYKNKAKVKLKGKPYDMDVSGQLRPPTVDNEMIYTMVDEPAIPRGGIRGLYKSIVKTLKYPELAKEKKIEGRVIIEFVIEKDGSLTNLRLIKRIGGGCDEEAMRAVKSVPKWQPAKHRGLPVRTKRRIPVMFKLH